MNRARRVTPYPVVILVILLYGGFLCLPKKGNNNGKEIRSYDVRLRFEQDLANTTNNDCNLSEAIASRKQSNSTASSTTIDELWDRLQCFAHRFSYLCNETNVRNLIQQRMHEFLAVESRVHQTNITNDVLVIGNSHSGQLGEALICAFQNRIVHMAATDLYTGCLIPHKNLSEPCDGQGIVNHCGMYLAVATLDTGGRILLANNHPWLFGGAARMTQALDHMQVRPEHIGTVFIGPWNPKRWVKQYLADRNRVLNQYKDMTKYPFPQFVENVKDTNGEWHNFSRCGGGIATIDDRLIQEWTVDQMLDYLSDRGFRGTAVPGTLLDPVLPYTHRTNQSSANFTLRTLPRRANRCACPTCRPSSGHPSEHSCMPGEPFLYINDMLDMIEGR